WQLQTPTQFWQRKPAPCFGDHFQYRQAPFYGRNGRSCRLLGWMVCALSFHGRPHQGRKAQVYRPRCASGKNCNTPIAVSSPRQGRSQVQSSRWGESGSTAQAIGNAPPTDRIAIHFIGMSRQPTGSERDRIPNDTTAKSPL